jgi:uncharacterized protein
MIRKLKAALIIVSCALAIETALLAWLWISRPRRPKAPPAAVIKGKIAIVLDDWGYTLNNLPILGQINAPLTLSVLPHLQYSRTICEEARVKGFQLMLHLPMQPHENIRLEKNTILLTMDAPAIRSILNDDLNNLAYIKGVNNHMGSLATENEKLMRALLAELKKRRLFFLDSFVSFKSLGLVLARQMKVKSARRDIFLDNSSEPAYIRAQMNKLRRLAVSKGQAIGIGHDRKNTLEVLKELIPQLEKEGYKFVFVSEIAE